MLDVYAVLCQYVPEVVQRRLAKCALLENSCELVVDHLMQVLPKLSGFLEAPGIPLICFCIFKKGNKFNCNRSKSLKHSYK